MEKIYIDENIYCIENFLSEEDYQSLMEEAVDEIGWEQREEGVGNSKTPLYKKGHNSIENLNQKIGNLVNTDELYFGGAHDIHRFLPTDHGNAMNAHYDASGHKSDLNELKQGIVYYLNDNFEGGELHYTKKNIKLKPKPNMLVIHPGDQDYTHEVLNVSGGIRYVITGFIYTREKAANE